MSVSSFHLVLLNEGNVTRVYVQYIHVTTIITITIIYIIVVITTYSGKQLQCVFDAVPYISFYGDMMMLW